MVRAVLEGVAHQVRWLLRGVRGRGQAPAGRPRAIGGGAQSDGGARSADVIGRPVHRVADPWWPTCGRRCSPVWSPGGWGRRRGRTVWGAIGSGLTRRPRRTTPKRPPRVRRPHWSSKGRRAPPPPPRLPAPDPHASPQVLTTSHDTGGTPTVTRAVRAACPQNRAVRRTGDLLRGDRTGRLLGHAAPGSAAPPVQVTLRSSSPASRRTDDRRARCRWRHRPAPTPTGRSPPSPHPSASSRRCRRGTRRVTNQRCTEARSGAHARRDRRRAPVHDAAEPRTSGRRGSSHVDPAQCRPGTPAEVAR